MEVPSLSSRLLVTVMSARWESQVLTSFSHNAASFAPFEMRLLSICAQKFATLTKVKSFVFKYSLASFPRFSYSLAVLWIPPTGRFRPPSSFPFEASAKTGEALENSNSTRNARISALNCGSFRVRFSWFRTCVPVFSTTYWLRSYFFCCLQTQLPPARLSDPVFSFPSEHVGTPLATKRREIDNHDRLS